MWGEAIAEHEREQRHGNGIGRYCIGGEDIDSDDGLTPLWWIVLVQEEWQHLLTPNLSLKLMLGICLMRREMSTLLQQLKIFIQENNFFVIMVTHISFRGN